MSVLNKLIIATELLGQTLLYVEDQIKDQMKEDIQKIKDLIFQYKNIANDDIQSQKMAFGILKNVFQMCKLKLNQAYGLYDIQKSNKIQQKNYQELYDKIYGKRMTLKQAQKIFLEIMNDKNKRQIINDININEFIKQNKIKIIKKRKSL